MHLHACYMVRICALKIDVIDVTFKCNLLYREVLRNVGEVPFLHPQKQSFFYSTFPSYTAMFGRALLNHPV